MDIRKTSGLPIYCWCMELDEGSAAQAENLAALPFAHHHIALMPDAHAGYGMPIGGVLAAAEVVVPNAVGVDIGCGMLAVKTSLRRMDKSKLRDLLSSIRARIPVGFQRRGEPETIEPAPANAPVVKAQHSSARHQLGTLGGGNHFIEIQQGDDGHIWYMVHSGSRNLGKQVCDHYNALAQKAQNRPFPDMPKAWELHGLWAKSEPGRMYIEEMQYCQRFARANRAMMSRQIALAIEEAAAPVKALETIDVHHNYAALETHFGKEVWVHRKGASPARKGEPGVIPGSQGTGSYIVEGLGNPDSFCSSSHGAGRRMGRKEAQRTLSLEAEIRRMDELGVVHGIRGQKDLDEAAGAYKDIGQVMAQQRDLVKIRVSLTPLAVVKG